MVSNLYFFVYDKVIMVSNQTVKEALVLDNDVTTEI